VTAEIRTVSEIDRPGAPYVGPALYDSLRVTVTERRVPSCGCPLECGPIAETDRGWINTGLLRAVTP